VTANTPPAILEEVAQSLGCKPAEIRELELSLYDTQKAEIGGLRNEFIYSARLDNLMSTFCALTALIESTGVEEDSRVRVAAFFDHEEVGSSSQQGADSRLMEGFLARVTHSVTGTNSASNHVEMAYRKSFLISADMAHGEHPNYPEKAEAAHKPKFHGGVTIKHNASQRYATNSLTGFLIKELAKRNNLPIQEFVIRNDAPCGSTIGPMLSANCGMRTIDVGTPQWAMHSIREMSSAEDVDHAVNLYGAFFSQFTALDASLQAD